MSNLGCPRCHLRPLMAGSTKFCAVCFEALKDEMIEAALEIETNARKPRADELRDELDAIDAELAPHLDHRASLEAELEAVLEAERAAEEKARLEAEIAAEEARQAEESAAFDAAKAAEMARLESEIAAEEAAIAVAKAADPGLVIE